jgi:hypothetical protein
LLKNRGETQPMNDNASNAKRHVPPPHVVMVKIEGSSQEVIQEIIKAIQLSGFDIINNSKHKPKLRFDTETQRWRVYVYIHEEPPVKFDAAHEALMTVEGI